MSHNFPLNHRILIVDDNPSIHADFHEILCPARASARTLALEAALFEDEKPALEPASFELDSAYQGAEALALVAKAVAENRPYAMAFVDVRMPPGWDGIETIARIWKVYPDLQVVVCTAYSDYSWEEMRAKVGQPDSLLILKKPFDNVEVQQMAHALTKKWALNLQTRLQMQELEEANRSLAISQERFSKAFYESPLPSGIQTFPEQRFVDVNQRLIDLCGSSRERMLGRTPAELMLWEKPAQAEEWYRAVAKHEWVRDQGANLRGAEAALIETQVSLAPLALGGQPHVLLLVQDVSERALLERQLRQAQKMEAIGQLAAGVAHDFNNIITVIQGYVGLMHQKTGYDAWQTKSLGQIGQAAGRATTLIRQLLMFSRKQVMQFRHLNLNDVLLNLIKMLERMVGEHIQIDFHPQELLPSIYADNSMMEQIAMNLAVNARDAMPKGGRLYISTTVQNIRREPTPQDPQRREGDYVCLTFRDTGIGMDASVLNRIFEPFFTTKPAGKGTGLGLSTVFGIVQQHKGCLEVESKPDHGTTFRIYFPASRERAEKSEQAVETPLSPGRETILLAEDEDALREMVAQVLRLQGYTVLEAASGPAAIDVFEQSRRGVDLLLTDLVMPGGMLGGELADLLTAKSPTLKVIFTSGYSPGIAGKDYSALDGRNFLPKPYSIGKLAQFVRECLDRKEG
ncbi:MAG TPA: response regulator [Verrucomicrobiae bacterium]|jgi:PAS domain S-box-containing protein|nr:response regulator [Verrucomicrobiae bacterium]